MYPTTADIQKIISPPNYGAGLNNTRKGAALPRVSVVVPSFNQGRFLERTIVSILNQQYPDTELIIIDGGSTDETVSVIKKYEKFIAHWVSEPDKGQSHALNKGLAKATGEIFAWQNSDDLYLPGAFDAVAKVFMARPEISVCYGNWVSIDENDHVTDVHYALLPRMPHAPFENMDAYNQSMFWRTDVCRKCGGFDAHLNCLMDTDFMIRSMLHAGPQGFYRLGVFLGAFRWHSAQKTAFDQMTEKQRAEERYLVDKFNFPPETSLEGKYYRLRYRFAQLFQSLRYGGPAYTKKKFLQTYRRRGRFL
ncbi:MAG: glycosyltransferase family 2 protein [Desulfosalsimonadaceae bacterium]|nr:glycosyltransferase family 2 protein [Desulfosalsimonadaceae bacterium]